MRLYVALGSERSLLDLGSPTCLQQIMTAIRVDFNLPLDTELKIYKTHPSSKIYYQVKQFSLLDDNDEIDVEISDNFSTVPHLSTSNLTKIPIPLNLGKESSGEEEINYSKFHQSKHTINTQSSLPDNSKPQRNSKNFVVEEYKSEKEYSGSIPLELNDLGDLEPHLKRNTIMDFRTLSIAFRKWCKKFGMKPKQQRAEFLLIKDKCYAVRWGCSVKACPFKIIFKRRSDGLDPKFYFIDQKALHLSHIHSFNPSPTIISSYPSEINAEIKNFIRKTAPSLKKKCQLTDAINNRFQTNFSAKQSYYVLNCLHQEDYGIDASDAKQLLMSIEKMKDIYYDFKLNEKNQLTHFIFASADMLRQLNCFSDVLIFDLTHNISKYDLNMALLVGLNSEGKSIILTYGLLISQQMEALEWLWKNILNIFKLWKIKLPNVILSDDGATVVPNIKKFFPISTHLLCSWHILQNIKKRIRSKPIQKKVSLLTHLEDIDEVKLVIQTIRDDISISEDLEKYIEKKIAAIESWCPAYQNQNFTLGIHTTSRVESLNSKFKSFLDRNCSLLELQEFISDFHKKAQIYHKPKQKLIFSIDPPALKPFRETLTYFAYSLLEKEYYNAIFFNKVRKLEINCWKITNSKQSTSLLVLKDVNLLLSCDCIFASSHGLPCEHILAVWQSNEGLVFRTAARWNKNYEMNKVLTIPNIKPKTLSSQILNPGKTRVPGRPKSKRIKYIFERFKKLK